MFKSKFGTVLLIVLGLYALFVLFGIFSKAGLNQGDDSFVNGHNINSIVENFVKREISLTWVDYYGTVSELKVIKIEVRDIVADEGSKSILKATAKIKGYYIPDTSNQNSKKVRFAVTKRLHIDIERDEVRLID